jgi:hypothetical protein
VACPLDCSSRPAKNVPATSAPMTTRAKMATANAMPRSFETREVDMSLSFMDESIMGGTRF